MFRRVLGVCVVAVMMVAAARAATVEDDFKGYPDGDPAIRNWMFRGVGGEVWNGEYRFNGVAIDPSEEGDVHPVLVMGQLRDFPAGPKLAIEADFRLGPKGFSFLDPAKKQARAIGVAVLDREFTYGRRDAMTIPTLRLTLEQAAAGTYSVRFDYAGEPKLTPQARKITDLGGWKADGAYRFSLTLAGGVAVGTIAEAGGKELYKGELRAPGFADVFSQARPAFANQRFEAALTRFRASDLDSFVKRPAMPLMPAAKAWKVVIGDKAFDATPDADGLVDVGKLAGGHGVGRSAVMTAEIAAPTAGRYRAGAQGDWFWKLDVNGKTVLDLRKAGNGSAGEHILELDLAAGANTLSVDIGSGSGGWNFRLSPPDARKVAAREQGQHIYGADRIAWNLDRLIDDVNNLKRFGIKLPDIETRLLAARRDLPADLSTRDAARYDPELDTAYLATYNAHRLLRLRDLKREIAGIQTLLGRAADTATLDDPERALAAAVETGDADAAERAAADGARAADALAAALEGYREGVTSGRGFGRFGWLTGDRVGPYSSGDGLLANQVLSTGALLRQYVTSPDGSRPWRLNFRFAGTRDAARDAELAALPTVGGNVEIEFGYDPTSFYAGSTPQGVQVKAVNWLHKRFAFERGFVADMSLGAPALLLESALGTLVLDDPATSPFTHVGFRRADGGIVSRPLADGPVYDRETDGDLGANWLLFWSDKNGDIDLQHHVGSVPVQVAFQRHPAKVEKKGAQYHFTLGRNGALWLNTPYGVRIQPAGNWRGNLPPAAAGRCDVHARAALAYPVGLREYYRPAPDGRVEIVNVFEYRRFDDNDWKLVPLELAPLPPPVALMADRVGDATLPDDRFDLGYPSLYGPLEAVAGGTVKYTLPVTHSPFTLYPRGENGDADARADAAEMVRWTRSAVEGIRFRLYCENIARYWSSVTNGMPLPMRAWSWLPQDFRDYLADLARFQAGHIASYRDYRFWRSLCEPYSGSKYFYSFSIASGRPGAVGVFGDRGWGIANHWITLEHYAAFAGDDVVKALWRDPAPLAPRDAVRDGRTVTVDKMQGYFNDVHDWAWMEAGSNDNGDNGPVVDCGQALYGGWASYRRLAERIGDAADRARGDYHLAKSQYAQIARPAYRDYGRDTGTMGPDHMNVGFRESVANQTFASSTMIGSHEYVGSIDSLFCYAHIDTPDIYYPYAQYAWPDLRYYNRIRDLYYPNRDRGVQATDTHLFSRAFYLMLDGMKQSEARALAKHWSAKSLFYIRSGTVLQTFPATLTGGCPLVLSSWAPATPPDFAFDPERKTAILTFANVPEGGAEVRGVSSRKPVALRVGGAAAEFRHDAADYDFRFRVPAGGGVKVEVEYADFAADRLELLPVPPAPKTVPSAPGLEPEAFVPVTATTPPPAKPGAAKPAERQVYRADFSGAASAEQRVNGWNFHHWGKEPNPLCGGLTGDYPKGDEPAAALKVCAVGHDYAGRASSAIALPEGLDTLVLRGEFVLSKDYQGNRPQTFVWTGKSAHFFDLNGGTPGETKAFEVVLPVSDMPKDTKSVFLQLVSTFDGKLPGPPAGSVYFTSLALYGRGPGVK